VAGGAFGREDAGDHHAFFRDTILAGCRQTIEQLFPVARQSGIVGLPEVEVVPEVLEILARLDRLSVGVVQAVGHDQGVAGVESQPIVGPQENAPAASGAHSNAQDARLTTRSH
jgi:hypothetical protein